jgi:hypothetical protein
MKKRRTRSEARSEDHWEVVFRKPWCSATKKLVINCARNIEETVMFMSKYSVDTVDTIPTISSMFRTQYTPDFFVAEYYGFRTGSATRHTTHLSSTVLSTVLCDPLLL